MLSRVHVGRIKTGDHRIKALLILGRQSLIRLGNHRIHKGIIVQGGIGAEIIVRRTVLGFKIVPLLLERNAEEGNAANLLTHEVQKIRQADAVLDIVGDMEMRVVKIRRHSRYRPH